MKHTTAGFALPVALGALVVMGILVTGGFFVAHQESRMSSSTYQGAQAFYLAERGIGEVVEGWDNERFVRLDYFEADTLEGSVEEGDWQVEVMRLGNQLYYLSSGSEVSQGERYAGATHTIGMAMRVRTVDIPTNGSFTTQGDVDVAGTANVDGHDESPDGWEDTCTEWADDGAGVTTRSQDEVQTSGASTVDGDPPHDTDDSIDDDTFTDFGDFTWDDLAEGADHVLPGGETYSQIYPRGTDQCNTSSPYNWGAPQEETHDCRNYFPTIHIEGDAQIEGGGIRQGQGLLLVDGDLHLEGSFDYYGVIITTGAVSTSGGGQDYPTVAGAVLSGNLDGDGEMIIDGNSQLQYSTCAINRALSGLNNNLVEVRPIPERTWADLTALPFS